MCKADVAFEVLHASSYATHDWDFAGPLGFVVPSNNLHESEARDFARRAVNVPIEGEITRSGRTLLVKGHSAELSEGGIGVTFSDRLRESDKGIVLESPCRA